MDLAKVYEPQLFEPQWAQKWVESGIYRAQPDGLRPIFSLVIPPPNVTGSLHMGHMLEHTEIDVTIRWRRMCGDVVLWLPGTDHAGIATQMVVERALAEEGLTRLDLGREKFVERVWAWKKQYGDTITRQMIRVGASCDWSRERFTLDPGLSRAVREVFVRLYEEGLIYRGKYLINWCPRCHTALSDLEVVHEETPGNLWHIRYPVKGAAATVIVATTRPETMLGDAAVAVNARDARYRGLHGKSVLLPLLNREIPVIVDDVADPEFGTGVVKVTPAHDPNDFEAGKRHQLPEIQVIGLDGKMTPEAGPYAGLDRLEARKRIVADLDDLGLLEKVEPYQLALGRCQRCKTPVEPQISTQWFVRTKPLAQEAIHVVRAGRIRFTPENWTKTYFEWMNNIRDWCISRQLWWGHRIPAWHCPACGGITVSRHDPTSCAHCGAPRIEQDPDVLDTWFSSALWPFSTLGWPDDTADLRTFYPTSLLITGFDILFFWVARMIMMGMHFMRDVPFREVYIHGLVRDAERQKMSKTKGNVIDPLEVTEQYGTDAVRLTLLWGAAPGTDIVLTKERLASSRAFANKLWNAARFLFLNMERSHVQPWLPPAQTSYLPEAEAPSLSAPLEDRWIFSRLNRCADLTNRAISSYRYHEAAELLWQFVWHEFCDWYLEIKKLRFRPQSGLDIHWRNTLTVFESLLRLLHPVMPFLTEELWQRLKANSPDRPVSISLAQFPQYNPEAVDHPAVSEITLLQNIVTSARTLRAEMGLDPKRVVTGSLYARGEALQVAASQREVIEKLANLQLDLHPEAPPKLEGIFRSTPEFDLILSLPAAPTSAQAAKLDKEIAQLEKLVAHTRAQLSNDALLTKAPPSVIDAMRQKLAGYEAQLARSRAAREALSNP